MGGIDRQPCPWRIMDDVGGAFCMGAVGGSIFHTVKGGWNAPKGSFIRGGMSGKLFLIGEFESYE